VLLHSESGSLFNRLRWQPIFPAEKCVCQLRLTARRRSVTKSGNRQRADQPCPVDRDDSANELAERVRKTAGAFPMSALIEHDAHRMRRPLSSASPVRRDAQSRRKPIPTDKPRLKPRRGLSAGWVIARCDGQASDPANGRSMRCLPMRCLQLATGQWCPPESATWFPIRSAAENYAIERGHSIGREVEIVYIAE